MREEPKPQFLQADVLGPFEARVYKLAAESKSMDEIEAALRSTLKVPLGYDVRTVLPGPVKK